MNFIFVINFVIIITFIIINIIIIILIIIIIVIVITIIIIIITFIIVVTQGVERSPEVVVLGKQVRKSANFSLPGNEKRDYNSMFSLNLC